jgi:uncharacterized membrane protein
MTPPPQLNGNPGNSGTVAADAPPCGDRATEQSHPPGQFSRVLATRRKEERRRSTQDRLLDAVTRCTGSLRFVYIHAGLVGAWIVWNLGWIPGLPPFDSSFVVLAMTASQANPSRCSWLR